MTGNLPFRLADEKTAAASDGTWFRKAHFLQLMSHELLAEYSCRYDDAANPRLELLHHGAICLSIDPAAASRLPAF